MKHITIFALFLFLAGCSGNVALKGTVTFSDDNQPVPAGTVVFLKDGKIARGNINPNGTYVVGFEGVADGLPPGTYQVYISGAEEIVDTDEETGEVTRKPLIDPKYTRPETSGLTLDVTSSTKTHDIKVERFKE